MARAANKTLRLAVLLASIVAGVGLAARVYWLRGRAAPVVIDQGASSRELLERARKDGVEPDPGYGTPGFPPPVARGPIDLATARVFYPRIGDWLMSYDPALIVRPASNLTYGWKWVHRTNSLGLNEDGEPSATPDLRVLVTGASNVQGICANADAATNLIEARLAERRPGRTVEALNAGCAYYNFYNYLAVLERYRGLEPDVFVVLAYGGNDFFGGVKMWRYFRGLGAPTGLAHRLAPMLQHPDEFSRQVVGTELGQVVYMLDNPADFDMAVCCACSFTAEIERLCAEDGIRLVLAYLPPPIVGQPELMKGLREDALARLAIPPDSIDVSERIADRWLEFARGRGIATCDLRPAFRASKERLYLTDTHINVAGQRLVAETLFPVVEAAAAPK